jgi:hypothetical protein
MGRRVRVDADHTVYLSNQGPFVDAGVCGICLNDARVIYENGETDTWVRHDLAFENRGRRRGTCSASYQAQRGNAVDSHQVDGPVVLVDKHFGLVDGHESFPYTGARGVYRNTDAIVSIKAGPLHDT